LSPSPHPDLPARVIIELLRSGETVRFRALGASMWPAIPSGSLLELESCDAAELRVGQVAAFERRGRVVVHRVRGITPLGVRFAGDNLSGDDGCIAFEHVLGRARVLERRAIRWRLPQVRELRWLWRRVVRQIGA
jgi:hypothetical protein